MNAVAWLDRRFYPGVEKNWDDQLFREKILAHLQPHFTILDLGAGAGIVPHMNFRGRVAKVVGLDPDPRVKDNPYLDEAHIGFAEQTPFDDASFDLVFADNVLEHIPDPDGFMREVARILRPGGIFLAKTPNRHHYMPLIARLTPTSFHRFVNRLRGRKGEDTFPTLYRLNTHDAAHEMSQKYGFGHCAVEFVEGRPEYLRLSALTYLFGIAYERVVNIMDSLRALRVLMLLECRKMIKLKSTMGE